MTDKKQSPQNTGNKSDEEKAKGVQPNPNVGQNKPDDKTKGAAKAMPLVRGMKAMRLCQPDAKHRVRFPFH